MSWIECANGLEYTLKIPPWVRAITWGFLVGLGVISLQLDLNEHALALVWLCEYRAYVTFRRQIARTDLLWVRISTPDRLQLFSRGGQKLHSAGHRVVGRYLGFISVNILIDHGKPLEILIFYRYDQRLNYRRLVRFLSLS